MWVGLGRRPLSCICGPPWGLWGSHGAVTDALDRSFELTKGRDMTRKTTIQRNLIQDLLHPPHVSQRCGAKARSTGEPCKRWNSIGHTRCKFHGGARGSGRPAIHGKYSAETHRKNVVVGALMRMVRKRHKKPDPVEV